MLRVSVERTDNRNSQKEDIIVKLKEEISKFKEENNC